MSPGANWWSRIKPNKQRRPNSNPFRKQPKATKLRFPKAQCRKKIHKKISKNGCQRNLKKRTKPSKRNSSTKVDKWMTLSFIILMILNTKASVQKRAIELIIRWNNSFKRNKVSKSKKSLKKIWKRKIWRRAIQIYLKQKLMN